ncbi:hypothetical protein AB0J86_12335 [Micromonospora sp. NPDC049559]|uniref:hypothetical protein n=1 Tax=Micromonospora sp. NPDC049559 TaxID=3155923 RepID=UPI003430A933
MSEPVPAAERGPATEGGPTNGSVGERPAPPSPYGAFAAVDALGGTAAPLLAGFAVTLLALVLQIESALRWPDPVLVLLGLAFVLFLQVVQLNAQAKAYAVTPAQALEWYADADDPQRRAVVDWELRHHLACWQHLVARTRTRYNLGVLTLLVGAAVMLVPHAPARLGAVRIAAIAVIGAGIVVELLELFGQRLSGRNGRPRGWNWLRRAVGWLVPLHPPVPPPPFPARPRSRPGPAPRRPRDS